MRFCDKFFEEAGDSLVEGILLVTKAIKTLTGEDKYCDLMMAQAILSLPNLAARLEVASSEKLKVWTSRPLSQLISVKDSEKTAASIIGTAQRMFQRFLKRDFVGAFCGQTTLPLDLDRSEEHTSELQSQSTISYAVFCLKKKKKPAKRVSQI